jgi:hypothetical protein
VQGLTGIWNSEDWSYSLTPTKTTHNQNPRIACTVPHGLHWLGTSFESGSHIDQQLSFFFWQRARLSQDQTSNLKDYFKASFIWNCSKLSNFREQVLPLHSQHHLLLDMSIIWVYLGRVNVTGELICGRPMSAQ